MAGRPEGSPKYPILFSFLDLKAICRSLFSKVPYRPPFFKIKKSGLKNLVKDWII
jgi:hypothetical protein